MVNVDYTGFSKKIKSIRLEKDITQDFMATKLNISKNTYMSYENDPANMKMNMFLEIGDILNVDIISIFLQHTATKSSK